ncbi:hypothetical protein ACFPJ1_20650 [Kribbella qitaiheensis]|uniref:hypothetical protein n=1 Tax=Kribbella qitaiheensis TaxID=1544730 RepID=UPI00361F1A24
MSGTATTTASTTAASSHHSHEGAPDDSAAEGSTAGEVVGDSADVGAEVGGAVSSLSDDRVGLGSGSDVIGEAASGRSDDRVGPGSGSDVIGGAVSSLSDDRVAGLGCGAVRVGEGGSERSGDRLEGLSCAVGLGSELGNRDSDVVGRSIEPSFPQALKSRASTARPTARITSGSTVRRSDPALLVTISGPFDQHRFQPPSWSLLAVDGAPERRIALSASLGLTLSGRYLGSSTGNCGTR